MVAGIARIAASWLVRSQTRTRGLHLATPSMNSSRWLFRLRRRVASQAAPSLSALQPLVGSASRKCSHFEGGARSVLRVMPRAFATAASNDAANSLCSTASASSKSQRSMDEEQAGARSDSRDWQQGSGDNAHHGDGARVTDGKASPGRAKETRKERKRKRAESKRKHAKAKGHGRGQSDSGGGKRQGRPLRQSRQDEGLPISPEMVREQAKTRAIDVLEGAQAVSPGQLRSLFRELEYTTRYDLLLRLIDFEYRHGRTVDETLWGSALNCIAFNGSEAEFNQALELSSKLMGEWRTKQGIHARAMSQAMVLIRNNAAAEAMNVVMDSPSVMRTLQMLTARYVDLDKPAYAVRLWTAAVDANVGISFSELAHSSRLVLTSNTRGHLMAATGLLLLASGLPLTTNQWDEEFRSREFLYNSIIFQLVRRDWLQHAIKLNMSGLKDRRITGFSRHIWKAVAKEGDLETAFSLVAFLIREDLPIKARDFDFLESTAVFSLQLNSDEHSAFSNSAKEQRVPAKTARKKKGRREGGRTPSGTRAATFQFPRTRDEIVCRLNLPTRLHSHDAVKSVIETIERVEASKGQAGTQMPVEAASK